MTIYVRKLNAKNLCIDMPYSELYVAKARAIPVRRWSKAKKVWTFPALTQNIEYVRKWFPEAEWDNDASSMAGDSEKRKEERDKVIQAKISGEIDESIFDDHPFKLPPMAHQKVALSLGWDMENFAYLMEPGTGKTFVVINDAAHNWYNGKANGMIVFCPNSVKTHWVNPYQENFDEISKHMPDNVPVNVGLWQSSKKKADHKAWVEFTDGWEDEDTFDIMVVNIESMHVRRVYEECLKFIMAHKAICTVDESTRIKNRAAQRTKNVTKLRSYCVMSRIMSGTPVIQSPLDAFAQFFFMDPDILGFGTYREFESYYAVKGGYEGYQILEYKNLEDLSKSMSSCSYIVTKEECLDLPPKVFSTRYVKMTKDQEAAYAEMVEYSRIELADGGEVTAPIVLTQLLRLQQITSGYLPILGDERAFKESPKIKEVLEIVGERSHKIIIWSRFTPEIEFLSQAFTKAKIDHFRFEGKTSNFERADIRKRFLDRSDPVQVLIGQSRTGGIGVEFYTAGTSVFLSNSFSAEDRVQCEDRDHRKGLIGSAEFIDILVRDTVDEHIAETVKNYIDVSKAIMNEGWQSWIQ